MRLISKLFNLNDPGWGRNNNGSQPPRRPQKNDGPPDLDEVWRDFNNRLNGLFGRKNRGGGNAGNNGGGFTPSPRGTRIGVGLIALIALGVWLASGFFIVQEGQVAVVTQFGKYKTTAPPGFQWRMPYPIQSHEAVNVSQLRTFEVGFRGSSRNKVMPESLMLTTDENIVDMQFVVQYRLSPDGAPDYLFNMRDPDESVRQAAETAMREIVGKQRMDFVLYEGRTQVAIEVQDLMQQILDRYQTGIQVSTVAIQNVQPPEQVQAAFDDAVRAGQDRERQINEGQAYANQVVPLARGQASRMLEQAEGYSAKVLGDAQGDAARFISILAEYQKAPAVMRERMYLETMQQVFQNASKVMVDTQNNNNMIYLPLDKIIEQTARDGNKPAAGSPPPGPSSLPGASQPSVPAAPRPTAGQAAANTLTRDRASR
ncbi:FtsH protease activity modulator HflK [Orrella sp. JC864]|uniref:FtsH protease activity modulator HflK n=1 Tax=Orrella sp. JC864 TaxID=3120298 RepID=UPI0012BC48BC